MGFFASRSNLTGTVDGIGKSTQIGVVCGSPSERAVLQQAIADSSELSGQSKAAVARDILHKALIRVDGDEGSIYENCLLDAARNAATVRYPEKAGICAALVSAYEQLAAGVDGRPHHDFGLPFVEYGRRMALENALTLHARLKSGEDPRFNLDRDFETLEEILCGKGIGIPEQVRDAISGEGESPILPVFDLVLDNWSALKDYQATFRFLAYLMLATDNWQGTAAQRTGLRDVCVEVSKDVETERIRKEAERVRARRDAIMTDIPMADGAVATVPRSWIRVTPPEPGECHYAGAIAISNPGVEGTPHFVFFLDQPVHTISSEQEEEIVRGAIAEWPPLADIKAREVSLEYASDGGIANYEEYQKAPVIGLFPLAEAASVTEYSPAPYGAVITRAGKGAETQ